MAPRIEIVIVAGERGNTKGEKRAINTMRNSTLFVLVGTSSSIASTVLELNWVRLKCHSTPPSIIEKIFLQIVIVEDLKLTIIFSMPMLLHFSNEVHVKEARFVGECLLQLFSAFFPLLNCRLRARRIVLLDPLRLARVSRSFLRQVRHRCVRKLTLPVALTRRICSWSLLGLGSCI